MQRRDETDHFRKWLQNLGNYLERNIQNRCMDEGAADNVNAERGKNK